MNRSISVVLPVHNEAGNLEPLYESLTGVAHALRDRYDLELLFVDDGSRDDSLDILIELHTRDPRVTVLSLSRNFGHQAAITAGLDAAEADAVVIMDSDLQDPPSVILQLVERWESGADVVYAQRRTRKDGRFKRSSAAAFYWILGRLASIEIPRNTGDFRLMDRRVVLELRKYREHNRFLRGLVSNVGFRQEAVLFDRDARLAGRSSYPLRPMLKFAIDGILGFSTVPLQLISRMGMLLSLLAFAGVVYVVAVRLLAPETTVPGWAFVMVAMFLMGGIQLIMLGVLGSYIGRVYVEVQNRPLYALALALRTPVSAAVPADVSAVG